ncbi:Protein FAR1-RELATED SEQUENCE 7 [Platanthera zijinensis]|uniref:Protein FAR1-RELATED SEQUENCE 7 n=1 Tax=Platanthera zijinensis TaxID=2320716 RepID=A0AAP0BJY0_9ASPA
MYCEYAHRTGFSVRKQHLMYWTHTRIVKQREYCCSKAGLKNTKKSPMKYRKSDTRTGCHACITFQADSEGKNWKVTKFVEEHNHPLATETKSHLLRSSRHVSEMQGCLHENRWLKDLHNIRRKWSTAFNKDVLDLGILSTQRSESANNCLHGCSKPTSALVECFSGMEKLVSSWRRNERDEDYKCKQGDVCLRYKVSFLLKQTSKQYSRKMFAFFEKNFMVGVLGVNVVDENKYDERNILYITTHNDPADGDKRWFVSYDSVTNQAQCSCRGFETKGLLCSHILRIYNLRNVRQIPGPYQAMAIGRRERRNRTGRGRVRVELPYCEFHQEQGHATATCPEFLEVRGARGQAQQPPPRQIEAPPQAREEDRYEDRVDVGTRGRIG